MKCHNCHKDASTKYCPNCGVKIPSDKIDEWLILYFRKGFLYKEILDLLESQHGIKLSMRTLKTKLKNLQLRRKKHKVSDYLRAVEVISDKMSSCSSSIGYRTIWHDLSHNHGVHVPRDFVMLKMRELDPEGAKVRRSRKLRRRHYRSGGPNYIWHCDGYDKLKPFGFPIHGCIDGFSRKILWLQVVSSNNNPSVIASLYLNTIKKFRIFPRCVRTDCGSENGLVAAAQSYLHRDNDHKAHMYGSSNHNQRIEAWWGQFRRLKSGFMMNFFKEMVEEGFYNCGSDIHKACAFYCFARLIQNELDECKEQWNSHYLRKSPFTEVHGRPDYLFSVPPFNFQNFGTIIDDRDLFILQDHVHEYNLSEDLLTQDNFISYFDYCVVTLGLPSNSTFDIAKRNFLRLLQCI